MGKKPTFYDSKTSNIMRKKFFLIFFFMKIHLKKYWKRSVIIQEKNTCLKKNKVGGVSLYPHYVLTKSIYTAI